MTKIEWTNETWNPIVGCSKVSEGCKHCYAERMAKRLKAMGHWQYQNVVDEKGWTGRTQFVPTALSIPGKWKKPRMIFVCSMSDLFHESVEFAWVDKVIKVIESYPQHTFQILTKRAERMAEYFEHVDVPDNVWCMVTVENQKQADLRIPYLLQVNAAVRGVSVEPMLGPVDLTHWNPEYDISDKYPDYDLMAHYSPMAWIDWVICGGESGPGARPVHPDWVRSLRDQCQTYNVPFFFKQWGEHRPIGNYDDNGVLTDFVGMSRVGKKQAGHLLDGKEWHEWPEVVE